MFKNVFYINLDARLDRKKSVEQQLDNFGWEYTRFSAVKHDRGDIGCSMSHLQVLKMALEKKLEYVVIVEDDILFTKPNVFKKNLKRFLESGIEYDVLFLGGNSYAPYPKVDDKINDFCIRTLNCQTTVGYVVQQHFYKILIDNFTKSIEMLSKHPRKKQLYCLDMYWKPLQKIHRFYFIIPPTVTQLKSYSDIDNKKWNNDRLMLNINKRR